jgi:hypothetical protein
MFPIRHDDSSADPSPVLDVRDQSGNRSSKRSSRGNGRHTENGESASCDSRRRFAQIRPINGAPSRPVHPRPAVPANKYEAIAPHRTSNICYDRSRRWFPLIQDKVPDSAHSIAMPPSTLRSRLTRAQSRPGKVIFALQSCPTRCAQSGPWDAIVSFQARRSQWLDCQGNHVETIGRALDVASRGIGAQSCAPRPPLLLI